MNSCVLLKFGEIVLKDGTRALRAAAPERPAAAARSRPARAPPARRRAGRAVARACRRAPRPRARRARSQPPSPGARARQDAGGGMRGCHRPAADRPAGTFAIRARRRDETGASRRTSSPSSSARRCRTARARRRSHAPRLEVHLEVDKQELFAFSKRIPGRGGLPVGVSGRAVCLLSGGIDSPVAAYRAMKRGLRCEFVHFSGRPFTRPRVDLQGVRAGGAARPLPGRLASSRRAVRERPARVGDCRRCAPAGDRPAAADDAHGVRARRAGGAEALVTGDSLGQVSSQTLRNLAVVEDARRCPCSARS